MCKELSKTFNYKWKLLVPLPQPFSAVKKEIHSKSQDADSEWMAFRGHRASNWFSLSDNKKIFPPSLSLSFSLTIALAWIGKSKKMFWMDTLHNLFTEPAFAAVQKSINHFKFCKKMTGAVHFYSSSLKPFCVIIFFHFKALRLHFVLGSNADKLRITKKHLKEVKTYYLRLY